MVCLGQRREDLCGRAGLTRMAYATETIFVVGLYALCSAGMLIINKLAVHHIGVPSFVTLCQFAVTATTVLVGRQLGLLVIDPHDWNKIKHFVVYVFAFSMGTWSNMKVLMVANVETIIVFRACSPIVVSFFDYWCYGRAPPSPRSILAMLTILAGALSYVLNDREFQVQGVAAYTWVAVWFTLLVFQLCYGKHLVTGLGLTSMWSSVLYTNGLSCMPTSGIGLISGEYSRLGDVAWTTHGVFWLGASCVVGTGISWAGFKCQSVITATAYTVVGVVSTMLAVPHYAPLCPTMPHYAPLCLPTTLAPPAPLAPLAVQVNKMLTVLLNVLIWDAHASGIGIASLIVCVLGGAFYQQAPLREGYKPVKTTEMTSTSADAERLVRRGKDEDSRGTV